MNELMKKLGSLLTDKRLTDLCPPMLELHQFAQDAAQLQHFLNRIMLNFGSSLLAIS